MVIRGRTPKYLIVRRKRTAYRSKPPRSAPTKVFGVSEENIARLKSNLQRELVRKHFIEGKGLEDIAREIGMQYEVLFIEFEKAVQALKRMQPKQQI